MKKISFKLNKKDHTLEVRDSELLIETLRDRLGFMGTKYSCLEGECGACTILLNGKNVLSCLMLSVEADNSSITTIEGLSDNGKPHIIQETFIEKGAIQCGFCTPGMILASKALLDVNPAPSEKEIEKALDGNLCRCTGYVKIVDAVRSAAKKLKRVLI